MRFVLAAALLLSGCAAGESPELACQKRIVAVGSQGAEDVGSDPFQHGLYAAVDRAGCTPRQLAALDRIVEVTKALPGLSDANDRAAGGKPDEAMAAFQRMNDSVIELNDLLGTESARLDTLAGAAAAKPAN